MVHTTATPIPTPPRKSSGFRRLVSYMLVLGILGSASYVAYKQGAMDQYLPSTFRNASEMSVITPVHVTEPSPNFSVEPPQAQPVIATVPLSTTPPVQETASVTISINGASANALLSAYDAQWQWQAIEQSFKSQGDAVNTLQQIQTLKTQLQNTHSAAFSPAIATMSQVETQLQAWTVLQTTTYLTALQQTISDVDQLKIQTHEETDISVSTGEQSWWQRSLASLKNVIEIKRVDEQKNNAALSASTVALVKQSIIARLSSAQLAAQMGQWPAAQSHAHAAEALAQQWADEGVLAKLKPFLDVASFPTAPEFNTVHAALVQARSQLIHEVQAAKSIPEPSETTPKGGA